MRKIIICILLFLVHSSLFSQQTDPELTLTTEDYLKKSKKQENAGLILLIGGLAVFATGAILPGSESNNCNDPIFCSVEDLTTEGIKASFKVVGVLSAIGSIPFFIESGKNRRMAASLTLSTQRIILMDKRNLVYTSFPALEIKISF